MTSTFDEFGLVLDKYADILAQLHELARAQWGDSIDLESDSYDGHIYELISLINAEINEIVQDKFDQDNIANATGAALDAGVAFIGMVRQSAAASTVQQIQLTAAKALTVPAGSIYSTSTGVDFTTDVDLVFTGASADSVAGTCTVTGAIDVAIGELNTITTSISGITAVTNLDAAVPGRLRQGDTELKKAHTLATETSGDNDTSSIFEALYQVTGVAHIYIDDNDTNETVDSVPAHNIYTVVIGGTDDDVATAIYNNKTSGVPTFGTDESVSVYNSVTSQSKTINFDRGAEVSCYVEMTIQKVTGLYPDDGDNTIKEGIAAMFEDKTLNDDVVYNELWGKIYAVPGVIVDSLYLGLSPSPSGTSNLPMTPKQAPTIDVVRDDDGVLVSLNVIINEA
jgi:hypothetical protein